MLQRRRTFGSRVRQPGCPFNSGVMNLRKRPGLALDQGSSSFASTAPHSSTKISSTRELFVVAREGEPREIRAFRHDMSSIQSVMTQAWCRKKIFRIARGGSAPGRRTKRDAGRSAAFGGRRHTTPSQSPPSSAILTICPAHNFLNRGAATFHAEAHVPAQPASPLEDARISHPDEDEERTSGALAPARQGSQARFGEARVP
jgi:hypothetical protein